MPDVPVDPKSKPVVCPSPATEAAPASGDSTAKQFPFPGDAPAANKPAAEAFPFPGDAAHKAAAPPKPDAAAGSSTTADQFPYPGETSKSPDAVPEGNTPRYVPDAPDSSSSSSSSSSSDTGGAGEPDKASDAGDGTALPKGRRPLPKVSALSPDERVTEDLNVAKFYTDRGNFQAAYLRAKDATKTLPDDAESHFALAQAAQKLQKKDEAAAEYVLYLKLDPVGDKRAVAQRALAQLK